MNSPIFYRPTRQFLTEWSTGVFIKISDPQLQVYLNFFETILFLNCLSPWVKFI